MKKKRIEKTLPIKWTRKSTFWLIVVILGLVAYVMLTNTMPEYFRHSKLEKYQGEVNGKVMSIKATTTVTQDFEGANTITPFYTVNYIYEINGTVYSNSNNIPNKRKYKKFIKELYDSDFKKEILVKYELDYPSESLIKIE